MLCFNTYFDFKHDQKKSPYCLKFCVMRFHKQMTLDE